MVSPTVRWLIGSLLAAISMNVLADSLAPEPGSVVTGDLQRSLPGQTQVGHGIPTQQAPRVSLGLAAAPLSDDALSRVRGGFVTDTGLQISFGIERAVYINGELVATTRLNTPDLQGTTAGRSSGSTGTVALIQNGAGNYFLSEAGGAALPSVVQNTLDNQAIRTITVINASVNSIDLLRSLTLSSSVRNSIAESLRR